MGVEVQRHSSEMNRAAIVAAHLINKARLRRVDTVAPRFFDSMKESN